jgi:hypothetical protein
MATWGTSMRLVLSLSLLLAACSVGEVGSTAMMGGDAGPTNDCVTRLMPPGAKHLHAAGGTSNQGQNCIVAGCHLNNQLGTGAPGYQFAGTLYQAGGTTPNAGAQVRIKAGTMTLTAYTDEDGNFSFAAGSLAGAFTANTDVTACPTVTKMVTPMVGGNGGGGGANSCNLCHTTGAGAQAPPITL